MLHAKDAGGCDTGCKLHEGSTPSWSKIEEAVQLAKQLIELLMNCNIKQSALNYSVNKTISS